MSDDGALAGLAAVGLCVAAYFMFRDDKRGRLVSIAMRYPGVGQTSAPAKYLDLMQSPDPADHTPQMVGYFMDPGTDSCALTVRGIWRKAGMHDPNLGAYRVAHAVDDVVNQIGKRFGAYVDGYAIAQGLYTPKPGDVGYVANPGPEHVFTITKVTPLMAVIGKDKNARGWRLESVDGGQFAANGKGGGQQIITHRVRDWVPGGGALLTDLPHDGVQRQVLGIINADKLPL